MGQDVSRTLLACEVEKYEQVVKLIQQHQVEQKKDPHRSLERKIGGKVKKQSLWPGEEQEQQLKQDLCLKCGVSNHFAADCGSPKKAASGKLWVQQKGAQGGQGKKTQTLSATAAGAEVYEAPGEIEVHSWRSHQAMRKQPAASQIRAQVFPPIDGFIENNRKGPRGNKT